MGIETKCPFITAALTGKIVINGKEHSVRVKVGSPDYVDDLADCALEELQKTKAGFQRLSGFCRLCGLTYDMGEASGDPVEIERY